MTAIYHLSGRQAKELHARGSELRLAIPRPADSTDDDDPLEFARAALPGIEPERLVAAEWSQVSVGPPSGDGLAGVIGVILDDEAASREWHWTVDVAIVTLRPRLVRRQAPRLQWPGKSECGGWSWPKPKGGDCASGAEV